MAPTTGYPNPFGLFGRGARQESELLEEQEEDEDVFDDADEDLEASAQEINPGDYEDEMASEDQLESEEELEDTAEVDPEDHDEVVEDQLEDEDEDMGEEGQSDCIYEKSEYQLTLNRETRITSPSKSPRYLIPRFMDSFNLQARLRRRSPSTPFSHPILAIRWPVATYPDIALL